MAYTVELTPAAERQMKALERTIQDRVYERLLDLQQEPRPSGVTKLRGDEAYRVRIGNYRIIYDIIDERLIVLVLAIGHRRDVYRRRR